MQPVNHPMNLYFTQRSTVPSTLLCSLVLSSKQTESKVAVLETPQIGFWRGDREQP